MSARRWTAAATARFVCGDGLAEALFDDPDETIRGLAPAIGASMRQGAWRRIRNRAVSR